MRNTILVFCLVFIVGIIIGLVVGTKNPSLFTADATLRVVDPSPPPKGHPCSDAYTKYIDARKKFDVSAKEYFDTYGRSYLFVGFGGANLPEGDEEIDHLVELDRLQDLKSAWFNEYTDCLAKQKPTPTPKKSTGPSTKPTSTPPNPYGP